jgi:hypothetical protein
MNRNTRQIFRVILLAAAVLVLSACRTLDARDREAEIAQTLRERYPAGTPLDEIQGSLSRYGLINERYIQDKRPTGVVIRTLRADLKPRKTPEFWLQDHGEVTFYFNADQKLEYLKVKKYHGERP